MADQNETILPVPEAWSRKALVNDATYRARYAASLADPDRFWDEIAGRLAWFQKWKQTSRLKFDDPVEIEWFSGGKLNACYNCVDRYLPGHRDRVAFFWEPEDPAKAGLAITYGELHARVSALAHGLKTLGVRRGDRVTVYLPMIPEALYAMLACARIGAVHAVIFAGFSSEAIRDRVSDAANAFVITADGGWRAGTQLNLKDDVDAALEKSPHVKNVIVVRHTGQKTSRHARDVEYRELVRNAPPDVPCEAMDAEDPLFLLYTSGSTNKPKGIVHTTGGYLVYASFTHEVAFDYRPGQVYWCAADIGWVTGHSYIVYGPLANLATSVLYEGAPNYPTGARLFQIVDKYGVNILYAAPTLIRALMALGTRALEGTRRASLELLGSVGEPINPEAWWWFYREVGNSRCPVVDTWWQTETGGFMILPLPGATPNKPGAATKPFFGVKPVLVSETGERIEGAGEGHLCLEGGWPGQMRTVFGDHRRMFDTYYAAHPGLYFTGDGARRDADGDLWITGRADDVLNVSGHRLGTAEVESALVAHRDVSEAAVVGFPHATKGQGVFAFVSLNVGVSESEALRKELTEWVKKQIGGLAKPDRILFAAALPKTRSGKIMRRILRKIAAGEFDQLGDTSTLAEPAVVAALVARRQLFDDKSLPKT